MQVYLDEQAVECELARDATVSDLVQRVRDQLVSADRLLVGIAADGSDLAAAAFATHLGRRADSFSRYDFTTGQARKVVLDALAAGDAMLERAEAARVQATERFTLGRTGEGLAALGECCAAWRQVHDTIASALHLLKLDPADLTLEGTPTPSSLADMKLPLEQIRAALDARDFVLVSDVLQYECAPLIDNWRQLIAALRA